MWLMSVNNLPSIILAVKVSAEWWHIPLKACFVPHSQMPVFAEDTCSVKCSSILFVPKHHSVQQSPI